ncbi:GumC family protein [Methylomagnum sp.]
MSETKDVSESKLGIHAGKKRIWIFVAMFLLSLICGMTYVWIRPPIYKATASVLTVAPRDIDQQQEVGNQYFEMGRNGIPIRQQLQRNLNEGGGTQHVSIQKQILLGIPLLEEARQRLKQDFVNVVHREPALEELQSMLSVEPIPETNLVELQARGQDAQILAQAVNTWLDVYQEARESAVIESKNNTTIALEGENSQLDRKLEDKRRALDQFRRAHDILSKNDTDNQAMTRLSGLNNTLNKANDDEIKAKAKLDAIKEALAKGEPVLPPEEQQGLANLEQRAQQLRELVKDLGQRYTPQYIALQPKLKLIPEQLEQIEAAIRKKLEEGKREALSEAEQEYASARQTIQEIRRQISEHKREAADFTAKFAEYEAMSADLEQLELLYRKNQSRLAEIGAKQIEKYPQLEIVDRAYPPTKPVSPDYWRDTGIAFIASLGAALTITLLYDYLMRREGELAPIKLPDVRVFSVTEDLLLGHQREAAQALPQQMLEPAFRQKGELALDSPLPRELSEHEIRGVLESAEPMAQQLIGLILSGFTLEEAMGLDANSFDLTDNTVNLGGNSRGLPLAPRLRGWLIQNEPLPLWAGEASQDVEELSGVIAYAMADSGIFQPETADAEALRHTYLMYLIRQGVRLADLERIVGRMSAKVLARYARYSPPGAGLRAESIALIYPTLNGEYQV